MIPGLTYQLALVILGISAVASNSLIALWVALSRRHWFWRAAALLAVEALLLSIPARDLAWFFLAHAAVVVLPIAIERGIRGYRRHVQQRESSGVARPFWQFSLRDLLLATVAVGVATADFVQLTAVEESTDWTVLAAGAATGLITLCAALSGIGKCRAIWRVASLLLVAALAGVTESLLLTTGFVYYLRGWPDFYFYHAKTESACSFWIIGPAELVVATWLFFAGYCAQWITATDFNPVSPPMELIRRGPLARIRPLRWVPRIIGSMLLTLLSLAVIVPVALTFLFLPTAPRIPEPFQEGPNAYPRLLELASTFNWGSITSSAWETAPVGALQTFASQNRDVFAQMHELLDRTWWFPVDYLDSGGSVDSGLARSASRAYSTAMRRAFLDGDVSEAERLFVDALRLGHSTRRGGLIVEVLIGDATDEAAITDLYGNVGKLTELQCRELIRELLSIEAAREDFTVVLGRKRLKTSLLIGWEARVTQLLRRWCEEHEEIDSLFEVAGKRAIARMRLIICELAIRAFYCSNNREPESIDELVPSYLPAVPQDPFSDGPLVYRKTTKGHLLYSVGPNRIDDGGKRVPLGGDRSQGDLCLDTLEDVIKEQADAAANEDSPATGEDGDGEM